MSNTFIWTDLSTINIDEAKKFYNTCLGWKYQEAGDGYLICEACSKSSAGLYTMPEKFQRYGMPSFWMSYIHVSDINKTVRAAKDNGATIEIEPQDGPDGGIIALIRDPAGAGFTCYEGKDLGGKDETGTESRMAWNELHVSSLTKIESFYTNVFGWTIAQSNEDNRFDIYNASGLLIGGICEYDNEVKGDKEYWGVYFTVACLQTATEEIKLAGGEVVFNSVLGDKKSALAYDSQGAAFFLLEGKNNLTRRTESNQKSTKWRALFGLLSVFISVYYEINWIWGILFLAWIIPDLKTGSTHFLEHVERRKNPIVYWLIMGTWCALSLYLLFELAKSF